MDVSTERFAALRDAILRTTDNETVSTEDKETLIKAADECEKYCKQLKISQESFKTAYNDAANRLFFISKNINNPKTINDQFQDSVLKRFIEDLLFEIERLNDIISKGTHDKEFKEICEENVNLKKEISNLKEQLMIRYKELQAIRNTESENTREKRENMLAKTKSENAHLKERLMMIGNIMNRVKMCFADMTKDMVTEFRQLTADTDMPSIERSLDELAYQNIPQAFRNPVKQGPSSLPNIPLVKPSNDDRVDSGIGSMDEDMVKLKEVAMEEQKRLQSKLDECIDLNKNLQANNMYLRNEISRYQNSEYMKNLISEKLKPYKEEMNKLREENEKLAEVTRERDDLKSQVKSLEAIYAENNRSSTTSSNTRATSLQKIHETASLPSFPTLPSYEVYSRSQSEITQTSPVFSTEQLYSALRAGAASSASRQQRRVPEPYQTQRSHFGEQRLVLVSDGGDSPTPSRESPTNQSPSRVSPSGQSPQSSPRSSPKSSPKKDENR